MSDFSSSYIGQDEKQQLAGKLQNELIDYFRFVELLNKKRSQKNTRLIEEYIKMEQNIRQRISFIEELDKEARFAEKVEPTLRNEDVRKAKEKVKPKKKFTLSPTSFFSYILNSSKSIKFFGVRTNIIKSKLFGLIVRHTGESEFYYKKILQESTILLLKPVQYILDEGWRTLDRKAYNTVVTFSRFLKNFTLAGNILNQDNQANVIKQMETYIEPFLQISGKQAYKEVLKESFYKVLLFVPQYKKNFREINSLLNAVIDTESRGMCFFNIIMGIYSMKYRHLVRMQELLEHYDIQDIDETYYQFSPKVIQIITEQLKTLESKFRAAEEELFLLKFVDHDFGRNVNVDENSLVKVFHLIYYHDNPEKLKRPIEDNFFEILFKNLTPFKIQFLSGFEKIYGTILKGTVSLVMEDGGEAQQELFKEWLFNGDLEKLHTYLTELSTFQSTGSYIQVNYSVFDKYNNTGKTEIEKEERLCNIYKKIISTFYSIGEGLSNILFNNYRAQSLSGQEKFDIVQKQNETIEDFTGEPQLIPYAIHTIADNSYLSDRRVLDVLNEIIIICLNYCQLFNFHPLNVRVLEQQRLMDITEEYINIKSKIDAS